MKLFNVREHWINRGIAIGEKRAEDKVREERRDRESLREPSSSSNRNGKK